MIRLAILSLGWAVCLGGCVKDAPTIEAPDHPVRIVSLDYCADQYVLKLADREDILAVSQDAEKSFSYMRDAAAGLPKIRPSAEDVLLLKPDLVVRSYGGGPNAASFFNRAGIPVLQLGYANDMEGIRTVMLDVAAALGEPERGQAVIDDFDARLAAIAASPSHGRALYVTPGGVTSGPDSLINDMFEAAGLDNFEETPGWRSLPLERLAHADPDVIAAASFDEHITPWSAARHPILAGAMERNETIHLDGSWTSCGGWFLVDAIEALAERRGAGQP